MLWPKIHTRNLITKKNSCGSKIPLPPNNFSNGPSLIDCFYLDAANKSLITTVSGRKKFNCFLSKKITYPIKCPVQTPYFI